jgi:hypothetical protein
MKNKICTSEISLPSELERRQIYFWLKKTSSLTAWRRIFRFYQSWAEIVEQSVREADKRGWAEKTSLPESEYVLILKGLAHCEEGLIRLEKGDKRVFKFDANGDFEMASRILKHWVELEHRIETGDNGINEEYTPFWREFCQTLQALSAAWRECSMPILEHRYFEDPAPTTYNSWLRDELANMSFANQIEVVPEPDDSTFVKTNDLTPFSGIWEPIEAEPNRTSLLTLFIKNQKPQPPFNIIGTMNYLHGGSEAPQMTVSINDESVDLNTTWRLIWRDDRYCDGVIPQEEHSYSFKSPEKILAQAGPNESASEIIWAETGSKAPVAGQWLVESNLTAKITVEKGDALPLYQGREVRWIFAFKL